MPHAPLAKGKKTDLPGSEIGKHPWQKAKKRICQGQEGSKTLNGTFDEVFHNERRYKHHWRRGEIRNAAEGGVLKSPTAGRHRFSLAFIKGRHHSQIMICVDSKPLLEAYTRRFRHRS